MIYGMCLCVCVCVCGGGGGVQNGLWDTKPYMNWRWWGIPPIEPRSVSLNASGVLNSFWDIKTYMKWRGGAYPQRIHDWCNWMHLIMRNKSIYGKGEGGGGGIWTVSEILSFMWTGGGGA